MAAIKIGGINNEKSNRTLWAFNNKKKIHYLLSGPTADQSDIIGEYYLPELKVGDQLIIKECGAYSETLSTSFYGYNKSTVHIENKNSLS